MNRTLPLLVGMLLAVAPALAQPGDAAHANVIIPPADIELGPGPPALPAGVRVAALSGNPAEPGPFVLRILLPANYRVPPHTHPADEHVTVLSGTLNLGTGGTFSREGTTALAPGGFAVLHAEMPHFVWTDVETTIQVHGTGPFAITYVNPADDPRGQTE